MKHGFRNTRTYRSIWTGMKQRCNNQKNKDFYKYGGKGIKVCPRWLNSFVNFIEDMGWPPSNKHTIERINNSLGYNNSNCIWATVSEQNKNRKCSINIKLDGEIKTLKEWCNIFGVNYITAHARIFRYGMDIEVSIKTKTRIKNRIWRMKGKDYEKRNRINSENHRRCQKIK